MRESLRHPELELSAYLDGELDAPAREAIEAHLRDCVDCSAVLADLRAVVAEAHGVEDRAPAVDLWPGIARRIESPPALFLLPIRPASRMAPATARRFNLSVPQLAAAALFVALLSGGTVWWTLHAPHHGATAPDLATGGGEASSADFEIRQYDQAVAELQRALDQNRSRLGPETVSTVESNLAVIDSAIAQARRALAADPANPYLTGHLAEQMKRKIRVLQRTADAMTVDYSGDAS
jgi:putative zinc finger protein